MSRHLVYQMLVALVVLNVGETARTEIVPVEFLLDAPGGSVNRISLSISALGLGDSDTANLSGNVLSNLDIEFDIDDHDAVINTVEFTGGTISFSDMRFDLRIPIIFSATARTQGVKGTLGTPGPPTPVTGDEFPTEGHVLTLNQGKVSLTGDAGNSEISFANEPLTSTTTGVATLTISPPNVNGDMASYDLQMRLPVNFDQVVDANGISVRIFGSGNVVASGTFTRDLPNLLPSDLTGNGSVDFQDLTILLANWNKPNATPLEGNLVNPDGTSVDFQDLTTLLAAWTGSLAGAPAGELAAAAVPEPSSLALLAMAAMSLVGWPRRRRM